MRYRDLDFAPWKRKLRYIMAEAESCETSAGRMKIMSEITEMSAVTLKETNGGKLLEIQLTGKLVKEDYQHVVLALERLVKDHGKIRLLVEMHDFHGWTAGALWEDLKFDAKHFSHIERLALVGESKWQHGMAVFCKPFTAAKIRYFDRPAIDQARDWLASA
jgi:hypothetical protein